MKRIIALILCMTLFISTTSMRCAASSSTFGIGDVSILSSYRSGNYLVVSYRLSQDFDWPSSGLASGSLTVSADYVGAAALGLARSGQSPTITSRNASHSAGTHTHYLYVGNSKIIGSVKPVITFTVKGGTQSHSASINGNSILLAPTGVVTDSRTITKYEAIGVDLVKWVAPGLAITLAKETALIKVVSLAYMGWTFADAFSSSLNLSVTPEPITGQYWVTKHWYTSTGQLKQQITVWNSYSAYRQGDLPLYKGAAATIFNYN